MSQERTSPDKRFLITRREALAAATFVPLAALTACSQATGPAAPTALTEAQRKTLEAFIDRLIPTDELGPGAVEAGAQHYIDRALAGALAAEKDSFLDGLQSVDDFAQSTQGKPLAELSAEQRDALLTAIDNDGGAPLLRGFFNRARRLAIEGMFGDPFYGGNVAYAGWDLIRYPGPRPMVTADMQRIDKPPEPYRHSAREGEEPEGDTV